MDVESKTLLIYSIMYVFYIQCHVFWSVVYTIDNKQTNGPLLFVPLYSKNNKNKETIEDWIRVNHNSL